MEKIHWDKPRLVIGLAMVLIAALFFVFARGEFSTTGLIAIAVLGIISIATARKKTPS